MSWVMTLLINEILSAFSCDFTFLPLGNTPLKGARTLRKPDAVLVPPHAAARFREIRDKFYGQQVRDDANELGYWKSLVDNDSNKFPSRVCPAVVEADDEETPSP